MTMSKPSRISARSLLCALLVLAAPIAAFAQQGGIRIEAVDEQGKPVVDAKCVLSNKQRAFTYSLTTDKRGFAAHRFIDGAPYDLLVEKAGYQVVRAEYSATAGGPAARANVLGMGRKLEDAMDVGPTQKLFQDFYVSPGVTYDIKLTFVPEAEAQARWEAEHARTTEDEVGPPPPPTPGERMAGALPEAGKKPTFAEALASLKGALGDDFDEAEAAHQLASHYETLGNVPQAREAYARAAELQKSADLWARAAWLARDKAKDYPAAVADYQKALALDAKFTEALGGLGYTYEQMGRKADAVATYQKLVEADPSNAAGWERLVAVYTEMGQHAKAAEANRRLAALTGGGAAGSGAAKPDPVNLYNQGVICLNQRDTACAEKFFLESIAADAAYAPAHYQIGMLYMNQGKCAKAVPHFEAFLKKPDTSVGDPNTVKALLDYCKTQK